jgi:hypothetical protein
MMMRHRRQQSEEEEEKKKARSVEEASITEAQLLQKSIFYLTIIATLNLLCAASFLLISW